jgi:hypothetical protein
MRYSPPLTALLLLACGAPEPAATPQEKRILQQIRQAPDARVILCDSAGTFCDARRDSLLKHCLPDPDCQVYTVQKNQWPWLWEQLKIDN